MITKEDVEHEIRKNERYINPTSQDIEIIEKTTNFLTQKIGDVTPQYIPSFKDCVAGGSSSRRTFLPGKLEIDLFVRFKTESIRDLEEFAQQVVPKIGDKLNVETQLRYSENPYGYLEIETQGKTISVDMVATIYAENYTELKHALKISGMARTPFHSQYLAEKIKGKEEQIRAFKFWLKKKRCYGNASLTGFLSELLVLEYGSFYEVLKKLPLLPNAIIDPFGRSPSKLKNKFKHDQVIIVDPTDKERNAAAGIQGFIGKIRLSRLIEQSEISLRNEQKLFQQIKIPENHVIIIIEFVKEPNNEDDKFYMLARLARAIHNEASMYDYRIEDVFIKAEINSILICPDVDSFKKEKRVIKGPPIHIEQAMKKFKEVHDSTWVKEGRLFASVKNEYGTIIELITAVLNKYKDSKTRFSHTGYIREFNLKVDINSNQLLQLLE